MLGYVSYPFDQICILLMEQGVGMDKFVDSQKAKTEAEAKKRLEGEHVPETSRKIMLSVS
jgi:hypothetical protein